MSPLRATSSASSRRHEGSHLCPFGQFERTGKHAKFDFAGVLKLENGKVSEFRATWGTVTVLTQLGLLHESEAAGASRSRTEAFLASAPAACLSGPHALELSRTSPRGARASFWPDSLRFVAWRCPAAGRVQTTASAIIHRGARTPRAAPTSGSATISPRSRRRLRPSALRTRPPCIGAGRRDPRRLVGRWRARCRGCRCTRSS